MELSRQEYWSGLPFPSPGDLPNPGIQAASPALDSLPSERAGKPYVNLHTHPFSFSYVPRTDIAVLCGKSSFHFLSTLHNLFHTGYTHLHSDQQYTRVPVSLHPCPYLLSLVSLMVAVLTGVKWFPIVQLYIYCVYFLNLYIWLYWVLVAACRAFSCSVWPLVHWSEIKPWLPELGVWGLHPCTTWEVLLTVVGICISLMVSDV